MVMNFMNTIHFDVRASVNELLPQNGAEKCLNGLVNSDSRDMNSPSVTISVKRKNRVFVSTFAITYEGNYVHFTRTEHTKVTSLVMGVVIRILILTALLLGAIVCLGLIGTRYPVLDTSLSVMLQNVGQTIITAVWIGGAVLIRTYASEIASDIRTILVTYATQHLKLTVI